MRKTTKSKAELMFTGTQKKADRILQEQERAALERQAHTAKLRALRLEKEAADKEAADKLTAEKAAAKAAPKKTRKPARLPQTHRT